jgi:hypothetical protein
MGELSWLHLTQLLNAAACGWQAEALLEASGQSGPKAEGLDHTRRLLRGVQWWAYLFLVEWQGWERFCAELHLEGDALLQDLPGYATVKEAEARAASYKSWTSSRLTQLGAMLQEDKRACSQGIMQLARLISFAPLAFLLLWATPLGLAVEFGAAAT